MILMSKSCPPPNLSSRQTAKTVTPFAFAKAAPVLSAAELQRYPAVAEPAASDQEPECHLEVLLESITGSVLAPGCSIVPIAATIDRV